MSSEPTIEQKNEVIALFMGGSSIKEHGGKRFVYYPKSCAKDVAELKYHSSWDALMPLLKKIKEIIDAEEDYGVKFQMKGRWTPIENELCNLNITNVHYCIYQFIRWREEMISTPAVDHGMCKDCKTSKATIDYNGHGCWVCAHCNEMLNDEFDREYQ